MFKVRKYNLILITGIVWSIVSILLIKRAVGWFPEFSSTEIIIALSGAALVGVIKTYFIFIKVTHKNVDRIMNMEREKIFVFEMHTIKLYILIALMIATGSILRNIEFVPKFTLFPIYAGVGMAMTYAGILYFISFHKIKLNRLNKFNQKENL
jgi:hypothetical protein